MLGSQLGLSVRCEDEAGPFQAVPHAGASWQPREHPGTQTASILRAVVCEELGWGARAPI